MNVKSNFIIKLYGVLLIGKLSEKNPALLCLASNIMTECRKDRNNVIFFEVFSLSVSLSC